MRPFGWSCRFRLGPRRIASGTHWLACRHAGRERLRYLRHRRALRPDRRARPPLAAPRLLMGPLTVGVGCRPAPACPPRGAPRGANCGTCAPSPSRQGALKQAVARTREKTCRPRSPPSPCLPSCSQWRRSWPWCTLGCRGRRPNCWPAQPCSRRRRRTMGSKPKAQASPARRPVSGNDNDQVPVAR